MFRCSLILPTRLRGEAVAHSPHRFLSPPPLTALTDREADGMEEQSFGEVCSAVSDTAIKPSLV